MSLGPKDDSGFRWILQGAGLLLLVALIVIGAAYALAVEDVTGRASVVDGDTIEIQGKRVRFDGIDAPESGQTCTDNLGAEYRCGRAAAFELDKYLAASRPIRCELTGDRSWKRWIGTCYRADGENVSAWLVREGWALPAPRYARGRFREERAAAKAEGRGLWQGKFTPPWEWRRSR